MRIENVREGLHVEMADWRGKEVMGVQGWGEGGEFSMYETGVGMGVGWRGKEVRVRG